MDFLGLQTKSLSVFEFWAILALGPIFRKNLTILAQYFQKSTHFWKFEVILLYKPWIHMKNHQKWGLKWFLSQNIAPNSHFLYIFTYIKYKGKWRFSSYPAALKRQYLELGIRYWHSVKSADFVNKSTPSDGPPLRWPKIIS